MVLLALAGILTICAACDRGPEPPPAPPETFTATAKIRAGEVRMEATLLQERPGCLRAEFSAPAEIEGMVLELSETAARLTFGETEQAWSTDALPESGFMRLLRHALLRMRAEGASAAPEADGGWTLGGQSGAYLYTALLGEDGRLRRLDAPKAEVEVELTYF